jgi:ribosomal protein L7/L12
VPSVRIACVRTREGRLRPPDPPHCLIHWLGAPYHGCRQTKKSSTQSGRECVLELSQLIKDMEEFGVSAAAAAVAVAADRWRNRCRRKTSSPSSWPRPAGTRWCPHGDDARITGLGLKAKDLVDGAQAGEGRCQQSRRGRSQKLEEVAPRSETK